MTRSRPFHFVIALFVWLFSFGISSAEDWTTHRYDASRSGSTPESLTLPLTPTWTYSAPAKPKLAWSGPDGRTIEGKKLKHRVKYDDAFQVAAVGNKVYFGSSVDHQVRCVDADTGKQIWSFFTSGPIRLAPTVWNGQVFVGSDDGYACSLEADTGKLIWQRRVGPEEDMFLGRGEMISRWAVRTGITIYDGIAYFGGGIFPYEHIYLYAVDAKSGKLIWKGDTISELNAGRNPLSPQGFMLANEDYLFVPSGRALPACFDRKTGKLVHHRTHSWRSSAGGVVGGTRAFLADGQIYAAGPHHMLAMDQKTGNVGFGYFEGKELVVAGKYAYAVNGSEVTKMDRPVYAKASVARQNMKNTIYDLGRKLRNPGKNAKDLKDQIAKLMKDVESIKDKGIIWSTPSKSMSALIVAGNHVFVGGEKRVDALDVNTGKILWTKKTDDEVRGLAVANGHLYVSTTSGRIYAFADAKQPKTKPVPAEKFTKQPYPRDDLTPIYEAAAEDILKQTGVKQGYCLILGTENGRLAWELAKRSELRIYGIEPNKEKVDQARKTLSNTGKYGHRIVIHHADLADIPYSNYFANLIVSDSFVITGQLPGNPKNFIRHLKPLGGVAYLGQPHKDVGKEVSTKEMKSWLIAMASDELGEMKNASTGVMFVRGKLRGAGNWSHQYGEPGNTASSDDQIVKGNLGVLWFGDPGPGKMVNRHEGAVGPLSVNGRLIVQGQDSVMAYDAYNGMFLWEYENPKTFRTGVFQNANSGNLVAGEGSVFIMEGPQVTQLDIETGKLQHAWKLPPEKREDYQWSYFAYQDGILFGTASIRKELAAFLKRRGHKFEDMTDAVFAIDVKTGKYLWVYEGKNIAAPTIALGPDRVYFVDSSLTPMQREIILTKYKDQAKKLKGEAAKLAEARMKRIDARMAIALEARSGKKAWSSLVDVTDCSKIGIGGGELTLMYHDDTLVLCGANANGHYWRQFVAGEFKERRLVALSAKSGKLLWAKDANYRHRPIIIGSKVIAEPWAFDLFTGKKIMRKHPLTGKEVPWSVIRPGHHCGMLTGAPNLLMFRSGYTGFYDLYNDGGTQHFAGHRLGCWINAIPANGLVMIPEASAGCVCQFSIASTITLAPKKEKKNVWTIYSAVGNSTPVQRMSLNLGAPGDRKDGRGKVWLAYPRPVPGRTTSLDLPLDLQQQFVGKGGFKHISALSADIDSFSAPSWLFTSWAQGLKQVKLPLRGAKDGPAKYTVRLYFADLTENAAVKQRLFDIKIQGKTVVRNFDPVAAKGKEENVVIREFGNVQVDEDLLLELVPKGDRPSQLPILNALEVVQEE